MLRSPSPSQSRSETTLLVRRRGWMTLIRQTVKTSSSTPFTQSPDSAEMFPFSLCSKDMWRRRHGGPELLRHCPVCSSLCTGTTVSFCLSAELIVIFHGDAMDHDLVFLDSRHFSGFLWSHHFCKYQIEVLTSGSVFLADILFSESALFYFSEVSRTSFVFIFLYVLHTVKD